MSFSEVCNISFVIRGVGVGDGAGEGTGVGDGVCATEVNGSCVATKVAAPRAGSDWTNARRLLDVVRRSDFLVLFFTFSPFAVLCVYLTEQERSDCTPENGCCFVFSFLLSGVQLLRSCSVIVDLARKTRS
jgi:hypothetical protein